MDSYMEEIASHPTEIFERSCEMLIEIADALITSPSNSAYHQLNMRKFPFDENLTEVSGAYDALRTMGFEDEKGPDKLRFPVGSPLEAVRTVRGQLAKVMYSKHQKASAGLAWQLTRCEAAVSALRWARGVNIVKPGDHLVPAEENGYSFVPSKECVDAKRMRILYSCVTDRYELQSSESSGKTYIRGWQNGIFRQTDAFRMSESDWKMVYLTRIYKDNKGKIAWRIDLHSCGQRARNVAVAVNSKTFFDGRVQLSLCGSRGSHSDDGCSGVACLPLYGDGKRRHFEALSGCDDIWLLAFLDGGTSDFAWQYAQLFRDSVSAHDEYSHGLDILIELA